MLYRSEVTKMVNATTVLCLVAKFRDPNFYPKNSQVNFLQIELT